MDPGRLELLALTRLEGVVGEHARDAAEDAHGDRLAQGEDAVTAGPRGHDRHRGLVRLARHDAARRLAASGDSS